ncbi:MAG: hypothetical protein LBN43_07080 [Oscillospiraceae bacterium]|jgi:hypothetical protein|nr:hypothetical protein [Oscillospiraceae bacterium]
MNERNTTTVKFAFSQRRYSNDVYKLTPEQKANYATTIAGERGMKGVACR